MSLALSSPAPTSFTFHPNAYSSPSISPLSIPRRLNLRNHRHHRFATIASAAVPQKTSVWTPAPIYDCQTSAESLFHVAVDLSDSPDLAESHKHAGQFIKLQVPYAPKEELTLAIASPPKLALEHDVFEFLVMSEKGTLAEALRRMKEREVVGLGNVEGNGFDISQTNPPENYSTVLIFATGSGRLHPSLSRVFIHVSLLCVYVDV